MLSGRHEDGASGDEQRHQPEQGEQDLPEHVRPSMMTA
jgi:hypothetical protein